MRNPLDSLKALWNDRKKRPWLIGGAGAIGTAAYLTMRAPAGTDAAAEETAVQERLPDDNAAFGIGGDGMSGTYVTSPDYDPAFEEIDFAPIFSAIESQAEALEGSVATQVKTERQARKRQIGELKQKVGKQEKQLEKEARQNKRQKKRLDNQRKRQRQLRKQLARMRQRAKKGGKKGGGK